MNQSISSCKNRRFSSWALFGLVDLNYNGGKRWIEEDSKKEAVSEDQERCTKQRVPIAVRKLKCLLSPVLTDLCTAEIATRNINQRDFSGVTQAQVDLA